MGVMFCCWQNISRDHATVTSQVPVVCDSCPISCSWACVNIYCDHGRSSSSKGLIKVRMHSPTPVKIFLHVLQIGLLVLSSTAGAPIHAADPAALASWSAVPTDRSAPFGSAIQPMPGALPVCSTRGRSCSGTRLRRGTHTGADPYVHYRPKSNTCAANPTCMS